MFVQGQHTDTATFAIWACLKFDFSLTFDLLTSDEQATVDNFGCLSKVSLLR